MKKRTLLALAVAMSVTAVAAANPFSDVPAKHWAYDSVMKLEKAGIVEGFGDGTFRGDRTMTRYEMAQIIARAMARVEKADAALKAELDKLSEEFAQELKTLGVRVTALENQTQNVKFSGDFRLRYDHTEDGYPLDGSGKPGDAWWKDKVVVPAGTKGATYRKGSTKNGQTARFRMQAEGKVNDNWTVVGRFVGNDDLRTNDEGSSAVKMDKLFVKGQMGSFGVRVGRIDVFSTYGLVFDDYMDAVELSYARNNWYATARYGNVDNVTDVGVFGMLLGGNSKAYDLYQLEAGTAIGSKVNVKAAYWHFETKNQSNFGIWEAGVDAKFGKDFKVTASVADTDGTDPIIMTNSMGSAKAGTDMAWFAQVDYKGAKRNVVNSWGVFGGYRDFENSLAPVITTFNTVGKGWYVGGSFAPAKNVIVKAWYENMQNDYNGLGDSDKRDYVRAQAEFFF